MNCYKYPSNGVRQVHLSMSQQETKVGISLCGILLGDKKKCVNLLNYLLGLNPQLSSSSLTTLCSCFVIFFSSVNKAPNTIFLYYNTSFKMPTHFLCPLSRLHLPHFLINLEKSTCSLWSLYSPLFIMVSALSFELLHHPPISKE